MQQSNRTVELGIERIGGSGEPEGLPEEIDAINTVMDGSVQESLDQQVAAAREACPNANCCLFAAAVPDSAEGGSWDEHPMNDTTYKVSFIRVDVDCARNTSDGCRERVGQLTYGVASMAKTCIDAVEKADASAREKTDAAAEKAKKVYSTAKVERARETVKAAEKEAAKIKSGGKTAAKKARNSVYSQTRKEIVASLNKKPA